MTGERPGSLYPPFLAALQAIAETSRPGALDTVVTDLPFNPLSGLVIRGLYRGLTVGRAAEMEHGHLDETYALVYYRTVTLRPWWRLWRPTPALRLSASCPHSQEAV